MIEVLGNIWIIFMLATTFGGVTVLMLVVWYLAIKTVMGRIKKGYWS
jgi:hypothetical protein